MPTLQEQLDRFETRLEECRRAFLEDGRIDPDEQAQLDRLNSRIRELRLQPEEEDTPASVGDRSPASRTSADLGGPGEEEDTPAATSERSPAPASSTRRAAGQSKGGSKEQGSPREGASDDAPPSPAPPAGEAPSAPAPDGSIPRFGVHDPGPLTREHCGYRLTIHAIFGGEQFLRIRQLTIANDDGEVGYRLEDEVGGELTVGYGDNRVRFRRSGVTAEASVNVLTLLPGIRSYCDGEHVSAETTFSLRFTCTEEVITVDSVSFRFAIRVEVEAPGGLGSGHAEAYVTCETADDETTCSAGESVEIRGPDGEILYERDDEVRGRATTLFDGGTGSLAIFWAFNQIQAERLGQSPDGRRLMLGPGVLEETDDGPVHQVSPRQLNTRFRQLYAQNLRFYNEIYARTTRARSIDLVDADQSDPRSWTITGDMQRILSHARGDNWDTLSEARDRLRRHEEEDEEE